MKKIACEENQCVCDEVNCQQEKLERGRVLTELMFSSKCWAVKVEKVFNCTNQGPFRKAEIIPSISNRGKLMQRTGHTDDFRAEK